MIRMWEWGDKRLVKYINQQKSLIRYSRCTVSLSESSNPVSVVIRNKQQTRRILKVWMYRDAQRVLE